MRNRKIWALWLIGFLVFLGTSLSAASQYTEKVVIPQYNPNNPTHVLITPSNGKWNKYVLNNPNYKHFYLKPGKYSSRYINLTRSGSKNSRRTLSLLNGNNTHPAALPDSQVANVWFHFDGADYWTIDRMANLDRNVNPSMLFINGATHNIINRWHLRNYKYGLMIKENCHYNTVQNSYINHATEKARRTIDAVGLDIYIADKGNVIGTKFINNDIRNATDGIQTTRKRSLTSNNANFEGTVIDGNRIWMDSSAYVNVNGSLDPKGNYYYGENAINLKAGSENPKNPMIITNNIIWGYKTDFQTKKEVPFASQYGTRYVVATDNIITNCSAGVTISGAENWEFKRNIIHNINLVGVRSMILMSNNSRVSVENNMLINSRLNRAGWSLFIHDQATNDIFNNNVFINAGHSGGRTSGHKFNNNWFYNSPESFPNINEQHFSNGTAAKMTDYVFAYERFTSKPKQKILKGIVTTSKSPHYKKAGAVIKTQAVYSGASVSTTTKPAALGSNTIVYENAEDGTTKGWEVTDNNPSGATISNFYDAERHSNVIELDGSGTKNMYRLGFWNAGGSYRVSTKDFIFHWSMNYYSDFYIFVGVDTIKGKRYLYYTAAGKDGGINGKNKKFIHFGLGARAKSGTWQTFQRNIKADLKKFESNNRILKVTSFLIRGSGKVDDIKIVELITKVAVPLNKITVYENAEDGKTNGWGVYDNSPAGATISNFYDAERRSNVIELDGQGTRNGYRYNVKSTKNEQLFRWSMNFNEAFSVYIGVRTNKGFRYLCYTADNKNKGKRGSYIHYGLGAKAKNGTWQTFTRNLQKDLQGFEPGSKILEVKSFLVRGSGKIDDIKMSNSF